MRREIAMLVLLAAPLAAFAHDANHEVVGGHLSGLVTCSAGVADGFPCSRINLLSWLDLSELGGGRANDIWGWVDPVTAREYVLVGRVAGTTFVDVTDPQAPVVLGYLLAHPDIVAASRSARAVDSASTSAAKRESCNTDDGHEGACGEAGSTWRDIKVYGDHAYIVSEQSGAGLQVFDLTQLRGLSGPPVFFAETAFVGNFSTAHNVAVNEDSGFLYVVGASRASGGLVIYDLSTPSSPTWVADYAGDGYTHDVQCVDYHGPDTDYTGHEVCFASNEDTLTILDVTNKNAISVIRRATYSGVSYSHQAWLSEDHSYLFSNDELDEYYGGGHTRTRIWDVRNLDGVRVTTAYDSPLWTIDHNNYVVGDYLFQANYTSGLRVLDISDPEYPWEVGFFDTYPDDDSVDFAGAWSNYPFLPSGIIAVSDIEGGLFLLQAQFLNGPLATADLSVDVGTQSIIVRVGDRVDRSFTVSNTSGADAPDVQVTLSLDGISLASISSFDGSCDMDGDTARCSVGTLSVGEAVTVSYSYDAVSTGQAKVVAMVSGLVLDSLATNNRGGFGFPVTGSSSSGGGGGGGGDGGGGGSPLLVLLAAAFLGLRRRRELLGC